MHLMSLLKAKAYSWARMEPSLASSKRLDDPHMNANCQNAQWLWFSYPYFLKKKTTLHILTISSYLDKPFISRQTFHTLTNLSYILTLTNSYTLTNLSLQTFHILTNLSYLDKSFISWKSLHILKIPSYLDNPFISWQSLHTLTNP